MSIYLQDWADSKINGLQEDFSIANSELEGVEILVAYYSYENYSGDAYVLFKKDGNLFEVTGGHCSCYGLEGQWKPEQVTDVEIIHRIKEGSLGTEMCWSDDKRKNLYADELMKALGQAVQS